MATPAAPPRGALPLILVGSFLLTALGAHATELDHILFQSIRRGDTDMLRGLIRQGTPVDVRAPDGTTPLMYAALHGDAESVRLLLARGADANAANESGATALLWGAGDAEKVRLLLEHGADPRARSKLGNTPLLSASAHPSGKQSVALLLASGADLLVRNRRGATALSNAVFTGGADTVRLLLARGRKTDSLERLFVLGRRRSAILQAANRGDEEIVRLLLEHGADPNESDGNFAGHAVNYALLTQNPDISRLLIDRGGDLTIRTPVGSVPPVVLAAYTETGDLSVARRMLEKGVDLNAENKYGETALTWARKRGDAALLELFERAGATEPAGALKTKALPDRPVNLHAGNQSRLLGGAIQRSLDLMQLSSDAFLRNRESCVSCHHQNLPAVALGWARDRGFEVDESTLRRMVERQLASWSPDIDDAYEMDHPVPVPPRFIGYGLLGLAALGYPGGDATEAMVWYLAAIQRPDGHWIPGFSRPPLGGREILATAVGLRSLQLYPLEGRRAEFAERVARARAWLSRAEPRTHQERVFRMLALGWSGSEPEDLEDISSGLLSEQREDGGWAQLPGLESDAWATGQTLVALASVGGMSPSHAAYQRGMSYLLRTQFDDGSWYVRSRTWPFQPHFDSRFPHGRDQWISAPATAWATMALVLAVEPARGVVVGGELAAPARAAPQPPAPGGETAQAEPPPERAAQRVDFVKEIKPLLERSCLGCHAGESPKASFLLTSRASLLKGGESGENAIVPGRSADSPLLRFVSGQVEDMEMPPLKRRDQYPALSAAEVELFRAWIDAGAPWPEGVVPRAPQKAALGRSAGSPRAARFAP